MSKQERAKWVDPRVPVSVSYVGRFKITVYDQAAYDASLREYPDDNEKPVIGKANNAVSQFKKGKPAARYHWTRKLDKPLMGTIASKKGESA
jgi:hypothetical protein